MRWLLAAATLLALGLAAALAARTLRAREPSPPAASPAPARCADLDLLPSPPLPELTAAPLVLETAPGLELRLDGQPAPDGLREGRHALVVTGPDVAPARLELAVDAFTPVLLEARVVAGHASVLVLGARCASCVNTGGNPELRFNPSHVSDLRSVAKGLAAGDWLEGAKALRGVPPSERASPEVIRLLAVLYALAGRPSLARSELELLPPDDAARRGLVRRDALEELKPHRQLETAVARWNAGTERFQRLTDAFVADAPQPLSALTRQFGELSKTFADAKEHGDAIGGEAALDAAHAALSDVVARLRALRPADCAWQRRVTDAL